MRMHEWRAGRSELPFGVGYETVAENKHHFQMTCRACGLPELVLNEMNFCINQDE